MDRPTLQIWIKTRVEHDGDLWSAYWDDLGIGSCGASEDEAIANLKNAVTVFCRALERRGILEKRLTEKGIQFETVVPKTAPKGTEKLSPVLV